MKKLNLTKKSMILYIVTLIVVFLGDQITKLIVMDNLQLGGGYPIIDNFFYFTYSQNSGAAWGILDGKMWLLFIMTFFAAIALIYFFINTESHNKLTRFGTVLIFAGMLGNLTDRIAYGYVRDFIDFIIFGYDFPVFNIADIGISVGVALVILEMIIEEYNIWKTSKSL